MGNTLTQDELRSVLDYAQDTGVFTWRVKRGVTNVGDVAGSFNNYGRRQIKISGRVYAAHRLAFLWMTGEWPKVHVDHKNRDPADNSWRNLREATISQNAMNRLQPRRKNLGLPTGVNPLPSGRYWARISTAGRTINIGVFDTPGEAHQAFLAMAKERDGAFIPPS
jgi:hypothetical protein